MGGAATMDEDGLVTLATDAVNALAMLELCGTSGVWLLEFDSDGTATCKESTPVVLDTENDGHFLVYETDAFKNVPMSGEATMTNAGVVTVNVVRSMVWNAGSFVATGNCATPAIAQIGSGPSGYTVVCGATAAGIEGSTHMPDGWDTTEDISFTLSISRPSGGTTFGSDLWYQCAGPGEDIDGSWAGNLDMDVTLTTPEFNYPAASGAFDPDAACDPGDSLWWWIQINGDHDATAADIHSLKLEYARSGGDQP
jgi:hypothetical protein